MATSMPNEKPGNLIMVGVPSKNGLYSTNFLGSLLKLGSTLNVSIAWDFEVGKPVDEARNLIVERAKAAGAKYLFFIDDDTIVPHFAIPRFLNMNVKVASGVYYTRSQPPQPVILKKDIPGGFKDWEYGKVIEVDYIGLGCAFIDMSVFDKMTKPYFKFQKGGITKEMLPVIGEDVWFCKKVAEEAGEKIWVDTYIQAAHEDFATKTLYFYNQDLKRGVWQDALGRVLYLTQPGEQTVEELNAVPPREGVNVCWGYGLGADGYEEANTIDLGVLRSKYAKIAAVKMKTVFEYRTNEETVALLTTIYNLMASGAGIEITVPDAVKRIVQIRPEASVKEIEAVMGDMKGKYRSLYTKQYVNEIAALVGFKDISTEEVEGDNLLLKAVK